MDRSCRRVLVAGRVQGVGFRWRTLERARALGLDGWVRNLVDGRVEALLEGSPPAVEEMLAWLRRGPPGARVDRIESHDEPAVGRSGFEIAP